MRQTHSSTPVQASLNSSRLVYQYSGTLRQFSVMSMDDLEVGVWDQAEAEAMVRKDGGGVSRGPVRIEWHKSRFSSLLLFH